MEAGTQPQIQLGCRYVPYDQWFITHVDHTWKIKHLKQCILAKALGLPLDPRRLAREAHGARPPSPITFAPDESMHPVSPIQFAAPGARKNPKSPGGNGNGEDEDEDALAGEEGYEEDDEWENGDAATPMPSTPPPMGGRVFVPSSSPKTSSKNPNPLLRLANVAAKHGHNSSTTSTPLQPGPPTPLPSRQQYQEQIFTSAHTLVRFSTGQILEEEYLVSWYDLAPHELVELHASSPPKTFVVNVLLSQLLLTGGTINNSISSSSTHGRTPSSSNLQHLALSSISTQSKSSSPRTTATTLTISHAPRLTCLPRHDPTSYVLPYWEGWVRALRVVSRSGIADPSAPAAKFPEYGHAMQGYSGGMGAGMAVWVPDMGINMDERGDKEKAREMQRRAGQAGSSERRDGRGRTKLEWKERWVVIREGVVSLCKDQDDPTPTQRVPLASLLAIRDVDHLITTLNRDRDRRSGTSTPATVASRASRSSRPGPTSSRTRSNTTLNSTAGSSAGAGARQTMSRRSSSTPRSRRTGENSYREKDKGKSREKDENEVGTKSMPSHGFGGDLTEEEQMIFAKPPASYVDAGTDVELAVTSQPRTTTQAPSSSSQHTIAPTPSRLATAPTSPIIAAHNIQGSTQALVTSPATPIDPDVEALALRIERSQDLAANRARNLAAERERQRLEREAREKKRLQKEREEAKKKRADQEKLDREMEHLRRWDDLGIGFGGKKKDGKGKEKEKDRKAGAGKGREHEGREDEGRRRDHKDSESPSIAEKEKEKERQRAREKEKDRARQRVREEKERERKEREEKARLNRDDRTWIPTSRDDADAAGMRIVCIRYHSAKSWDEEERERERERLGGDGRRYTSTGPSLAGDPGFPLPFDFEVDRDRDRAIEKEKRRADNYRYRERDTHGLRALPITQAVSFEDASVSGQAQVAPRKASLPGLGLGLGLLNAGVSPAASTTNVTNTVSTSTTGGPKFGIGGLFGKDKGKEEGPMEKEERKREEKERKSREKEKKADQKRRKKEEEEDEDMGGGSGLSWKLGSKKRSKLHQQEILATPSASTMAQGVADDEADDITPVQVDRRPVLEPIFQPKLSRPKLTLSPTAQAKKPDLDDSDSTSLSSPVFAHSTDSDLSGLDDDEFRNGERDAKRKGYRYGGYHHQVKPKETGKLDMPADATEKKHDDRRARKRKDDDKAEWIVLDLGTDIAFHSILRILHRHFSPPIKSSFMPSNFEDSSTPLERPPVNSNAEDNSFYANRNPSSTSNLKPIHPSVLTSLTSLQDTQSKKNASPALKYPEWRVELVNCARRRGMRESGRPLDLALHGWGRELDQLSPTFQKQRKKDEEGRKKVRRSFIESTVPVDEDERRMSLASHVSTIKASTQGRERSKGKAKATFKGKPKAFMPPTDSNDEDYDEDDEADDDEDDGRLFEPIQQANSSSHLNPFDRPHEDDAYEDNGFEEDDEPTDNLKLESLFDDSDEGSEMEWLAWLTDLPRQARVKKEKEDEEREENERRKMREIEDRAEQRPLSPTVFTNPFKSTSTLGSVTMLDSSSSTHDISLSSASISTTTLTRTIASSIASQSTSVSELPFTTSSSLHALPRIVLPRSQEEERTLYVEKRRKLEPSAISISLSTSSGTDAGVPPHTTPLSRSASTTSRNSNHQPVPTSTHHRFPSRSPMHTLSSPSSSESLGQPHSPNQADGSGISSSTTPPSISPTSMGVASGKTHGHGHTRSISSSGGFAHFGLGLSAQVANEHEKVLHHSASMPLTGSTLPSPPLSPRQSHLRDASASSATSSSALSTSLTSPLNVAVYERSLSKSPPATSANLRKPRPDSFVLPLEKPILTQAQIHQIESETEEMLASGQSYATYHAQNLFPSNLGPAPPPSPGVSRSNSIGITTTPTISPPSTIGRPGVSVKPKLLGRRSAGSEKESGSEVEKELEDGGKKERGILRKKLSDVGWPDSDRDDGVGRGSKQRPKLSLSGLAGGGPPGVHSPTSVQHRSVQSPTAPGFSTVASSSNNSTSTSTTNDPTPSGEPIVHSQSSSTMASAKALLRRVRSGSSLRTPMDIHIEEMELDADLDNLSRSHGYVTRGKYVPPYYPSAPAPASPTSSSGHGHPGSGGGVPAAFGATGGGGSSGATFAAVGGLGSSGGSTGMAAGGSGRKKKGTMERIVRGLDSALEFVEGR